VRVVVAVDAFKGCLSSAGAGEAVAAGVRAAAPDAQVRVVLVADGGEGTGDAVLHAVPGRRVLAPTVDALGRPVTAAYALLDDGTAVVEAASCLGLAQAGPVDATLPPRGSGSPLKRRERNARRWRL
jgi:glycerate kinase